MSFMMNGHGHNLQDSPCGSEQNANFRQTAGSKTSSPTKRAFEPGPGDVDACSPRKAHLETPHKDDGLAADEEDSFLLDAQDTALQHHDQEGSHHLLQVVFPSTRTTPLCLSGYRRSDRPSATGIAVLIAHSTIYGTRARTRTSRVQIQNQKSKGSKQRTRSAPPEMDQKDADVYAIPRTPRSRSASTSSRSNRGGATRGSARASDTATSHTGQSSESRIVVEDPCYRRTLRANNIHMHHDWAPMPQPGQPACGAHSQQGTQLAGTDR